MKLQLMDVNKFVKGLTPVTSTELKTRSGELHPEGLFSEKIFGVEGTLDRSKKYSYIELHTDVVHPAIYKLLIRIDRRLEKFMNTEASYSLDDNGNLIADENGVSGILELIKMFPKLKLKAGTADREKIIKVINDAYKDNNVFIKFTPIIPPDFRPMYEDESGNLVIDEINNIYLNIMRKASQVKSVGSGSPLFSLLNFYLQTAVNAHDKYVRTKIAKKHGLIRENMLGKRVDFSARGVITPGPQLDINQVGLPLRMAVALFEPFLLHYILFSKKYPHKEALEQELKSYIDAELSVDTIKRMIKSIKSGDKIPPKLKALFFDACSIVIKDRVVILKRDPALQDGSYRAFHPVLVDGDTIQLCTAQVGTFNADFDGDQMAVFHPLTKQAQQEAKDKMMRGEGSKNSTYVNYELSKEMVAGLYVMTKDSNYKSSPVAVTPEMLENGTDPFIPVVYRGQRTTLGRAIFNSAFPSDFPYINSLVTKKIVNKLIPVIINKYGEEAGVKVFSKLEKIGFKFATILSPTMTLDMIEMPESIMRIKKQIPGSSPEQAQKLIKEAQKLMIQHLKDTGLYDLMESGAGKGWGQPTQILVAKGVIADPKGNLLPPIEGSFADGLKTTEFFSAASGARKGMADRALNTATTGYFTRQLVYVLGPAEASATNRDCKTKRTVTLRLTNDMIGRLSGRYIVSPSGKLDLFNPSKYKPGDVIKLRTPILCESKKFCHTCYGNLLKRHKTPYVGILAGTLIGERGTQLIMRCSDGLVHHNGNLIPFRDLFNLGCALIENDGIETVVFNDKIKGKDDLVDTTTIQRHQPHDRMLFITTESGHSFVCQANHPLWIKKNNVHQKYENQYCGLRGDNEYIEYKSTRKLFRTDEELKEVIASDLQKYDFIWIDNRDALYNRNLVIPNVNAYVAGIYFAEGSKTGNDRRIKRNIISQTTEGPIKERIYRECLEEYKNENEKVTYTSQSINIWDNSRRVNDIVLGDYSYEKRLRYDFINYDKEWLKEFISGVIDGDGTVFTNSSTCCRIYTTSYYFVQQLNAICLKLGYKFNVCLAKYSKKYNRVRASFNCDIRFIEDPKLSSEKMKLHDKFIPIKQKKDIPIRGFDKITVIRELKEDQWVYPVYDIKTSSNEYLLNFVQNHNTFHTGGAATLVEHDILQEILDNDPLIEVNLNKFLTQTDNNLLTNKSCTLTIDLSNYEMNNNIQINEDHVWVNHLLSKIEYDETLFNILLDYAVHIKKVKMQIHGKESLTFNFDPNDIMLEVPMEATDMKQQVNYVNRLLGGKVVFKDPSHMINKVLKVYGGSVSNLDLCHFEVLISQILRDRKNQALPARLGKIWDPIMMNIKNAVFASGFIQGLAFENVNKAVEQGLISEGELEPSILGKLITGEVV